MPLRAKDAKDVKHEKIEKVEHKEKNEKIEHKEKVEIKEKNEKIEHKELKVEKVEKAEHKEKVEIKEKNEVVEKIPDKIQEGPIGPIGPGPLHGSFGAQMMSPVSGGLAARVQQLEATVSALTSFIEANLRPDLSGGALRNE